MYKKIIIYIVLNNVMWLTSIAMCYLDCFIDNLNYTFQDFLIIFFELLARITLVIGAIIYTIGRYFTKVIILIPFEEKCPNPCRQALNAFEHETSSYDKSHQ